ncbi:MAG: DUF4175 family protein, partial [Acidimicrobiales bacterium]|nr:DUF4175 family protein [Acidimicrobiales bacterium]
MTVRVGINGFGRIGRHFLRAARNIGADLDIVAVNDVTSADTLAYLLRYDSTHGTLDAEVKVSDSAFEIDGHRVAVLAERDPKALPWDELGVQVVIESTGLFTARAKAAAHLDAGAQRVIISAPSGDADATFVMGVNDDTFDPANHFVVSNASCTTNCFVPLVKVVDDAFGVESGLMTTVHAFTNDQNLLDLPHRDLRRARAAPINIVPASTGAARATGLVLQAMQGRLDGTALRVPVADGSITDFTAVVAAPVTVEEVNAAFAAAAAAGPELFGRFAAAFDWQGGDAAAAAAETRIDAWIDPPPYAGRPPMVIDFKSAETQKLTVFEDSTLVVRADAAVVETRVEGLIAQVEVKTAPPDSRPLERRWTIHGDGKVTILRGGKTAAEFIFAVTPAGTPTIKLTEEPHANISGSLTLAYR